MRTYVRLEVVAYEHMRRRFIAPFLLVGAMLMSACGSSSTPTVETLDLFVDDTTVQSTTPVAVTTTTTIPLPLSPIVWDKCSPSETKSIKCGTIKVPYSYEDPAIGTFTLSLKVHSAEDAKKRIGSLIVNRGGPGAESASMAPDAGFISRKPFLTILTSLLLTHEEPEHPRHLLTALLNTIHILLPTSRRTPQKKNLHWSTTHDASMLNAKRRAALFCLTFPLLRALVTST